MSVNYLDLRELLERLDDLNSEKEEIEEKVSELQEAFDEAVDCEEEEAEIERLNEELGKAQEELTEWELTYEDECKEIEDLFESVSEDTTLIPEEDFKEYAQDFAEDIGAIDRNSGWPCNCIDWVQAADELKVNYTSIEFQGTTYHYQE